MKCLFAVCLFVLFSTSHGHADVADPSPLSLKISIIRDAWVSAAKDERSGNTGAEKRIKLKGNQEFSLVDIDPEALKGKIVGKASLHLRSATPEDAPVMRLGVSTVASPWAEGSSRRYRREPGGVCFDQAMEGEKDWAYPGSTVLDAVFGSGNTIWRFADCTSPDADGWQVCAVSPDVVAAIVSGISNGFCLFDEVGSTWSIRNGRFEHHSFPNRYIYSRESRSGPWLEIWTRGTDRQPPDPVGPVSVHVDGLPPGEALCIWETPLDHGGGKTLGFEVAYEKNGLTVAVPRYLIPMAGHPGQSVRMHLQDLGFAPGETVDLILGSIDSAGNRGPARRQRIAVAGRRSLPFGDAHLSTTSRGTNSIIGSGNMTVAVLSLLDKVDPVAGTLIPSGRSVSIGDSHLYDASEKRIVLHAARNETVWFQLILHNSDPETVVACNLGRHPELTGRVFQATHVRAPIQGQLRGVPDPLIPHPTEGALPGPPDPVAGQSSYRSYICELYVPHHVSAGKKAGIVEVRGKGSTLAIDLELSVWNFTLPDKLSFIPEMNAYGRVSPYTGYDYYRLAHEHRTCLNRLPYRWSGEVMFAPTWTGDGFDWDRWDRHVGPLLDGTAFEGLKRGMEPVDAMYLPFNENWPIDLYENYTPSYWAEEALSPDYREALGKAFGLFAAHIRDRGWKSTIFEFFLNNKVYFREKSPSSSAPWIFDEPLNTQDFWALRWYGQLWQEAVTPYRGYAPLWFRADISRSHYARDMLQGIMDVEYTGGNTAQKVRMKKDAWRLWEPFRYLEYGSANKIEQANVQPVVWCLSAWTRGAIGVLPWQTLGKEESWTIADQNALFYPHADGPMPSMRLKAFTYGQQLVEYLTFLGVLWDVPRDEVAEWLKGQLPIVSRFGKKPDQDAGTADGPTISPSDLHALKLKLGALISEASPAYRRALVDLTAGIPVQRAIPDLGYVPSVPKIASMKPQCDQFRPIAEGKKSNNE